MQISRALLALSLVLLVGGCRNTSSIDAGHRAGNAAVRPPPGASVTQLGAQVPAHSAGAVPLADHVFSRAYAVVEAWSDALNRHDVDALLPLYAEQVTFYGRPLRRAAVIELKRSALAAPTGFQQRIVGTIELERTTDGLQAAFLKRSGTGSTVSDVQAKLVLKIEPGRSPTIIEESEESAPHRATAKDADSCIEVAGEVVQSLPEVTSRLQALDRAADQSDGGAHAGGIGPTEDDDGFTMELGIHTDEGFESYVVYSVDKAGLLLVRAGGADLAVPSAARNRVANACRH